MRVLFVGCHLKLWYALLYVAARIILTLRKPHANIEYMRYVIVFSALLGINLLLFILARRQNRKNAKAQRMDAALRHDTVIPTGAAPVNQTPPDPARPDLPEVRTRAQPRLPAFHQAPALRGVPQNMVD